MTSTQQLKVVTFLFTLSCFYYFDLTLFVAGILLGWILSGIAVSALYHRKISHRAFEYRNKLTEYFCYLLMIMSGQGTPLGWAIIHRTHHAKTDTIEDPQSPHSVGKFRTLISWYNIDNVNSKLVIDVLRDKKLMFLHNHYNKVFSVYALILFLINPLWVLYFAGVSVTVCAFFLGIVNTWGHSDVNKNSGTYAKNISFLGLLWGEETHKDHHISPSNSRFHDSDYCYWFIKLVGKSKV
jgi:stearoyl-CoA desaturase (delta-9 desaturase)